MYTWLWRMLPFGMWGKVITGVTLITGLGLLFWYVVFPAIDPLLPFNDVQVTSTGP